MKLKAANKPDTKPNALQGEPAQRRSREELLDSITRKLKTFLGEHERCSAPICKRARRCADPGYRCARDFPPPPLTASEASEVSFRLRKALNVDIARRKALGEWPGG